MVDHCETSFRNLVNSSVLSLLRKKDINCSCFVAAQSTFRIQLSSNLIDPTIFIFQLQFCWNNIYGEAKQTCTKI